MKCIKIILFWCMIFVVNVYAVQKPTDINVYNANSDNILINIVAVGPDKKYCSMEKIIAAGQSLEKQWRIRFKEDRSTSVQKLLIHFKFNDTECSGNFRIFTDLSHLRQQGKNTLVCKKDGQGYCFLLNNQRLEV